MRSGNKLSLTLPLCLATGLLFAASASAVPGFGTLFGTDANGGNILDVNPATGAAVVFSSPGIGVLPALANDPFTGVFYSASGGGNPDIYSISPAGVATLVGNTGLGFAAVAGMDFAPNGVLFAAVNIAGNGGTGGDHLAVINTNNGFASIVGPFGTCVGVPPTPVDGTGSCDIEGIEGIAFDMNGDLWGVHSERGAAGPAGLYSINRFTGAATFHTALVDAAGNPASGGFVSLQFDCNNNLLGGTAREFVAGAGDGGYLASININTGVFTLMPNQATTGSSLGGLSFELICAPIPIEETTWGTIKARF